MCSIIQFAAPFDPEGGKAQAPNFLATMDRKKKLSRTDSDDSDVIFVPTSSGPAAVRAPVTKLQFIRLNDDLDNMWRVKSKTNEK